MSTFKTIKKIEKQRSLLLSELQSIANMIRGTYVGTHRKCGKSTCWCAKESIGHPSHQISWTKDAKSRSKAIPKDDIPWIKEMTGNYRKWRTIRSNIRKLENELRVLIDKLEDDIVKKTEKLRHYF
jgi:hypothetical protein